MGKNVDFESIKATALAMVRVEPTRAEGNFGFLVYHPYYNSMFLSLYDKDTNTFEPINCFDEEKYPRWIEFMEGRIKSLDNIYQIFMQMNSAYLMNFLRLTYQYFNNDYEELAKALRYCWSYQEFPNWTERGRSLQSVKKLFRITRKYFMEPEEQEYYDTLPEVVTVYRGQSHDGKYYNALSWTDDLEKATWFAKRFEGGKLFKATIEKKYIFAFNNERGESELILDYTKLNELEEMTI